MVVDAAAYDDLFGDVVPTNAEGRVLSAAAGLAQSRHGLPFTQAMVDRFVHDEPMQAAGAAVPTLAWQHRDAILS